MTEVVKTTSLLISHIFIHTTASNENEVENKYTCTTVYRVLPPHFCFATAKGFYSNSNSQLCYKRENSLANAVLNLPTDNVDENQMSANISLYTILSIQITYIVGKI